MKQKREQAWRARHSQGLIDLEDKETGVEAPVTASSFSMDALTPYFENKIPGHDHWPPRANYYEHYALWSALTKPRRYLEIGVLRGWSTMAVLLGWPAIEEVALIDNEMYGVSIYEAKESICQFRRDQRMMGRFGIQIHVGDSKKLPDVPFDGNFDLIHVDGEHSERAVRRDLELVLPRMTDRGLIIVDDQSGIPHVKAGTDTFLKDHPELESAHVKTFTGHRLIWWSPLEKR
jgi:predicted O-methyltransferase YrrM